MRAFAVLAVVFDHTCQTIGIWQDGPLNVVYLGIFAVFLFFVHTTLVLMWSLERRPHTLDFYIRRVFRIYPLAMAAIVVVLLLHIPVDGYPHHPFNWVHHGRRNILANLLLMQNITHQYPVEAVMWSLPLEVQMYVVLPAIFVFARKERELWPILMIWALAAAVSWSVLPKSLDSNVISVVPNFLPGVVAYVGFMHRRERWPAWTFAVFLAALLLAFELRPSNPAGWACCLALGLLLPNFRQATNPTLVRIGHTLAKYSYSIYLLHLWSLALAFHYLHLHSIALKIAIEMVSLAVLAPLAYHYIEEPMIEAGKGVAARLQRQTREPALR